jgi:tellurite resistance protein TerA
MITLDKPSQSQKLSLTKGAGRLTVTARWIDNGDGRSDNDDLDLRAGVLLPNGQMHWVACSHPGAIESMPYARHLGDVRGASLAAPGEETIEVSTEISQRLGGRVAMIFSVYSAIENGAVSIAALRPTMRIVHGDQHVECAYVFKEVPKNVYTYVVGVAIVDGRNVTIRPSGMTSPPGSEATPWLRWEGAGVRESFDGAAVFKNGRGASFVGKFLGMGGGKNKYVNA